MNVNNPPSAERWNEEEVQDQELDEGVYRFGLEGGRTVAIHHLRKFGITEIVWTYRSTSLPYLVHKSVVFSPPKCWDLQKTRSSDCVR
ncbi:hypothetical protein E2P81_ATG03630 [Venturia nashicola]|nr:hypothetical protein E2P81_ATG03630 [Venturia nashicola]